MPKTPGTVLCLSGSLSVPSLALVSQDTAEQPSSSQLPYAVPVGSRHVPTALNRSNSKQMTQAELDFVIERVITQETGCHIYLLYDQIAY